MATYKHISVSSTTATARRVVQIVLAIGLLATLAITSAVTGAAPASASVIAPTGLTPASVTVNANPVLAWSAVKNASGYEVQLADDAGFNHVFLDTTVVNRQLTPTDQLPMQRIYWRVRTNDAAGGPASRWSRAASFTRSLLAGPALLAPANGATLVPPTQPPLLQWRPVDGAVRYIVTIATNPAFTGATDYTVMTTSLLNPQAQDAATYYWRVVAEIKDNLRTATSVTRSYVVGSLGPITGATPDADAQGVVPEIEQVVLQWDPLPGAVSYDVRVSTDSEFPPTDGINATYNYNSLLGTRFSPPRTLPSDDYYWQVRPRNTAGFAKDWDGVPKRRFTRTWSHLDDAATSTSGVPQLVFPADTQDAVTDDFYYQWTPARLATRYRLDVGEDPNFSPGTFRSCSTTQTTFVPSGSPSSLDCLPSVGITYYWRVKAIDGPGDEVRGDVQGIYSTIRSFVYTKDYVVRTAPAEGATVAVPTLRWLPARDADRYQVTLRGPGYDGTTNTYSLSFTPEAKLQPSSDYTWLVRSIDDQGRVSPLPLFGGVGHFTTAAADQPGTGVPGLTPTVPTTTTTRFPSLTWEPLAGAAYYRVFIGTAGSTFLSPMNGSWRYPAATDTSDTFLAAKNYRWVVAAYSDNGTQIGNPGPDGFFTIDDLPATTGQRVAIDASALDSSNTSLRPCTRSVAGNPGNTCSGLTSTPVLDWDPVPGAGYYMVYLARDPDFTNMVYGDYSNSGSIPTTTNTRWLPAETLADSQAGTAYYWFIRPCKAPGKCSPDPLKATNGFDKRSVQVTGLSSDASNGDDVTFSWQDYLTTNRATRDPLTNEVPGQAARQYHLQVARTAAFNDLLDDRYVDQRTYTAFDRLYPDAGTLYWRVQAIDGSGRTLPWSEVQTFQKVSPKPVIVTPRVTSSPASSTLTQTEPFRWTPTLYAARYDVEVYKNNDRTASPANQVTVPNGYIGQSAGTIDRPFATGTIYAWRVRRFDASGNPSAWSDWANFKVTGKAPTQTAPASKALVSTTSSIFRWSAVPTASRYRYERRLAGSSSVQEVVDTASTAYAPGSPLGTENYEWRVSTLDTSGQVVASSPWRKFRVDASAPYVVKVNPQSPFSRTATINVRFNEKVRGAGVKTIRLSKTGTVTSIPIKVTTRGSLVIINPRRDLEKATGYDLVIKAGLKDTAGLPLQPARFSLGTK